MGSDGKEAPRTKKCGRRALAHNAPPPPRIPPSMRLAPTPRILSLEPPSASDQGAGAATLARGLHGVSAGGVRANMFFCTVKYATIDTQISTT
jgi:hypothetical protein